jgi:hypothetical protein
MQTRPVYHGQPQRDPIKVELRQSLLGSELGASVVFSGVEFEILSQDLVGVVAALAIEERKIKRFTPARCAARASFTVASVLRLR